MTIDPRLHRIVAAQPYPLLFATISGAHLYGFPSPDSDYDLRGAHVLPLEQVIGLEVKDETIEKSMLVPPHDVPPHETPSLPTFGHPLPRSEGEGRGEGARHGSGVQSANLGRENSHSGPLPQGGEEECPLDMDIVSHDVRKFFGLLLKKNGYVLEQLFSPLIVHATSEHEELKAICGTQRAGSETAAPSGVITRHHAHHYFGFAETQWKLFLKESPRRVKPLLYVYRVLLTGIHLMRTGVIEANLVTLNEGFRLPYIADLIERKMSGENTTLSDADLSVHESEYQRLRGELQAAHESSRLPERPDEATRAALNDLLVRVRLAHPSGRAG